MMGQMYQVKRPSRSEFVPIRQLQYHVRLWGEPAPGKVPLVMVHGWMDVAASFQFMVDAFSQAHYVIAPDWRGFGLTGGGGADSYWHPDYLADLEFLLDHYAPGHAVNLVGHSMGGGVAMQYAGIRPQRVRRLVNLEGFGMPATTPDQAADRFGRWIDELKQLHRGELALRAYTEPAGVARRLMKTNPRLGQDKADWLAQHWAQKNEAGEWQILGEPAHKLPNAYLYRVDEVRAIHSRITMPTLMVEAADERFETWWKGRYTLAEHHERMRAIPQVQIVRIEEAGHMMHHDQPERLAALIEGFIA
ncbi:MAG: hypothetical protein RIS90_689 [Pseudomonadota bacterium]